jgi:hypothetical protein
VAGLDRVVLFPAQNDQRSVRLGELANGLKRALQRLVEVDRRPELAERREPAGFFACVSQCAGQLAEELLGPLAIRLELCDLKRRRAPLPHEEDDAAGEQ